MSCVIYAGFEHGFQTLTDLKCVLSDTRQAIVHGASSPRVDHNLSYFICLAQLRRPVRFYNAHQSWDTQTGHNNKWDQIKSECAVNGAVLTVVANLQAWCGPHPELWEQSSCPLCSPWSPRGSARPSTGWLWLVVELLVHQACREGTKRSDDGSDSKAAERIGEVCWCTKQA